MARTRASMREVIEIEDSEGDNLSPEESSAEESNRRGQGGRNVGTTNDIGEESPDEDEAVDYREVEDEETDDDDDYEEETDEESDDDDDDDDEEDEEEDLVEEADAVAEEAADAIAEQVAAEVDDGGDGDDEGTGGCSNNKSSDPEEIRKQVEFYFSDANLVHDRYLLSKLDGASNRSVNLNIILGFKRMARFRPYGAIINALKVSSKVDLHMYRTQWHLRRTEPFDIRSSKQRYEAYKAVSLARSIYVKGFGEETPSTQFDIEAYFQAFGPTNSVRLRRHPDKSFKGSVFVEFDSEKTASIFLLMDPLPEFKDCKLTAKSKQQYCEEKYELIKSGLLTPHNSSPFRGKRNKKSKRHSSKGKDRKGKQRQQDENEHDPKVPSVSAGGNARGPSRNLTPRSTDGAQASLAARTGNKRRHDDKGLDAESEGPTDKKNRQH